MRRGAAPADGFTLLEIVITLGILGIVIVVIYGVFARTLAAKEHTESRAEEFSSARAALNRIVADLQTAQVNPAGASEPASAATPGAPPSAPTPSPTPASGNSQLFPADQQLFLARARSQGGVALDDLAFSAFLRRPTAITFSAVDLGIVHYFVDALAPDSPRLGLYREALYSLSGDALDPDKPNPASSVLLVEDVAGFELRFFDGKDWGPEWNSTDTRNFAAAPRAVQMALTIAKEGSVEAYQTAIDLPMASTLANTQVVGTQSGGKRSSLGR